VAGRELGGDAFDLDEGHQLAIDAQPVVGELALDLVFGGEVGVLVEARAVAEEVGDQQAGVAFVGVASDQVG
jgi:proline racemase